MERAEEKAGSGTEAETTLPQNSPDLPVEAETLANLDSGVEEGEKSVSLNEVETPKANETPQPADATLPTQPDPLNPSQSQTPSDSTNTASSTQPAPDSGDQNQPQPTPQPQEAGSANDNNSDALNTLSDAATQLVSEEDEKSSFIFDAKHWVKELKREGEIVPTSDVPGSVPFAHKFIEELDDRGNRRLYRYDLGSNENGEDFYERMRKRFDGLEYFSAISDLNIAKGYPLMLGMVLPKPYPDQDLEDALVFMGCVTLNDKVYYLLHHPQLGEERYEHFISLSGRPTKLNFTTYNLISKDDAKLLAYKLFALLRGPKKNEPALRMNLDKSGNSIKPLFDAWVSKKAPKKKVKTGKTKQERNQEAYRKRQEKKRKEEEEKKEAEVKAESKFHCSYLFIYFTRFGVQMNV